MKNRFIVACILGLAALAPLFLMAQPEYMPRYKPDSGTTSDEEAPAPKPKKKEPKAKKTQKAEKGDADATPQGTDTASINTYLTNRLKQLQASHQGQEAFGRKLTATWTDFWQQLYNERKDFDIKMARQRLNHFQTLASLDPAYRRQATQDFEKLQSGLTKSFESSQRKKMEEFVGMLMGNLRNFGIEQDKWLLKFTSEAEESWNAQKSK